MSANDRYDALVIGGGHNGLTCAALLARGGRSVLVLEQREQCGGLAAATEFHPGHLAPPILHDTGGVRREVIEELDLANHGLRLQPSRPAFFVPAKEGPGLSTDELTPTDQAQLEELHRFINQVRGPVGRLLNEAPPRIAPRGWRETWPLLAHLRALRRLGRETMYELLRVAPMGVADWLDERLENDLLAAALASYAIAGTWCGPRSAGTAALWLGHECMAGPEVLGGAPALVSALLSAGEAKGVTIRRRSRVRRILLAADAVRGVELDGGERIACDLVASSVDPSQTFMSLIAPTELPPGIDEPMRSWRCRGTTAKVHLALSGPLEFACRPGERFEAVRIGESLDSLERAFDAIKYRHFSARPHLDLRILGDEQPTVSILVHFAPYELEGGWSDGAREALGDVVVSRLTEYAPTLPERILAREVLTPMDLARRFSLTGGHPHHGEHALDQLFWLRPLPSCSRYATPVAGLFLCGSGSHPGGGITCAPGWLAAKAICSR